MIKLKKGLASGLEINPRGFSKSVLIDTKAFEAVIKAQLLLAPDIKLIITRAYQPENFYLKSMRRIGAKVFKVIYPKRLNEIEEIFGHNGHALDGRHIDIGIRYKNKVLTLLPVSVFTTLGKIKSIEENNLQIIRDVRNALQKSGFSIHRNQVEALQVHCDFIK